MSRILTTVVSALALAASAVALAAPLPAAVGDEPTVRLAAAGDFAANADTRAVLTAAAGLDPDLMIALGDLSYGTTGAEQAWCDLVTSHLGAGFAFELLAGNHESDGLNGNINDFSACLPNQLPGAVGTYGRQYYVDVPAADPLVRLVLISPALTFPDGTWQYPAGSARYTWTSAAIDGARSAGIPWVVVGMHKSCLSLGMYACDPGPDLLNLLLTKRVDLVLTGHEHLYQRTAQLALGAACPAVVPGTADPDCVVDADPSMTKGAGTVLATVGTGGQTQRPVSWTDAEAPYFVAASGSASATWGVLDVQLTATSLTAAFVRGSGGTFTDSFTLTAPGGNQPPIADFTAGCTDLACSVDASASSDPDGSITGYAWDFGDGASGTGMTASHTYASAGTRTVTLTVTDDAGSTAQTTRPVTATAPPSASFAVDTFERTVSGGFGSAEVGGPWTVQGTTSAYAVTGGAGTLTFAAPGRTLDVALLGVAPAGSDLRLSLATDKPATGGGLYAWISPRRVAGVGEYRANLRLRPGGVVLLGVSRKIGSVETSLVAPVTVPGLTYTSGRLLVRVQAVGSAPTTVRARVWLDGTSEPTTWLASATDSTSGLQTTGAVGLNAYLSSSTTNAPLVVRIDDLDARLP